MFDGSVKRHKTVSLRGKSKEENTKELVQRLEKERAKRAREKEDLARHVRLQRICRGLYYTHAWRGRLRVEWDQKMADLSASATTPSVRVVQKLIQQLVVFYRKTVVGDKARLAQLCVIVRKGLNGDFQNSIFSPLLAAHDVNSLEVTTWSLRMSKLARICLMQLASETSSVPQDSDVLNVLNTLTHPATWPPTITQVIRDTAGYALLRRLSYLSSPVYYSTSTHKKQPSDSLFSFLASEWQKASTYKTEATPFAKVVCSAALIALTAVLEHEKDISMYKTNVNISADVHVKQSSQFGHNGVTTNVSSFKSENNSAFGMNTSMHASIHTESVNEAVSAFAGAILTEEDVYSNPLAHLILTPLEEHTYTYASTGAHIHNKIVGWQAVVKALGGGGAEGADMLAQSLSPRELARAVSNLLKIDRRGPGVSGKPSATAPTGFVQLLHSLLRRLPLRLALSTTSNTGNIVQLEEDSDDDEIEATASVDALVGREVARFAVSGQLDHDAALAVASISSELADENVMLRLFDVILPRRGMNVARGTPESESALALCALYGDLLMHAAAGQGRPGAGGGLKSSGANLLRSILNYLSFGRPAPIVPRLWRLLWGSDGFDLIAFCESAKEANKQPTSGAALYLFASLTSHMLTLLDDHEFYDLKSPLPREDLMNVVSVLKIWLQRYWVTTAQEGKGGGMGVNLPEMQLLQVATRLFNQLHERDARRSFVPSQHWHWEGLHENSPLLTIPPETGVLMGGGEPGEQLAQLLQNQQLVTVLANIPQVTPFPYRVKVFRRLIRAAWAEAQGESVHAWEEGDGLITARIHRDELFDSSFEQLNTYGKKLRQRVRITFINEHGIDEAGIDGGGVMKEYITSFTKAAFDPSLGLFVATSDEHLYPNPDSYLGVHDHLEKFAFVGRMLGKALFEGILVEPQLSPAMLKSMLGQGNMLDDLSTLDPVLYSNLVKLKEIRASGQDVEALSITFSVDRPGPKGSAPITRDLIPDGRNIPVTNANLFSYIHLVAEYKLDRETAHQRKAFIRGFYEVIPVEWVRMFSPRELQRLIGGDADRALDLKDLRKHTRYAAGYADIQPVMQWFWDALASFDAQQQALFLKFVTSCSRQPLLGFKHLDPPFCIQKVPAGDQGNKLPSSSTCVNLLKLPQYKDYETMREKLLYAISAGAGFELT